MYKNSHWNLQDQRKLFWCIDLVTLLVCDYNFDHTSKIFFIILIVIISMIIHPKIYLYNLFLFSEKKKNQFQKFSQKGVVKNFHIPHMLTTRVPSDMEVIKKLEKNSLVFPCWNLEGILKLPSTTFFTHKIFQIQLRKSKCLQMYYHGLSSKRYRPFFLISSEVEYFREVLKIEKCPNVGLICF